MSFRRIIKSSLISFAVLGMVGGTINSNVANAKHRRYHYRYTRRIKRVRHYKRRGRLYRRHRKFRYRQYHRTYLKRHHTKHYSYKYQRIRNHKSKYRKHLTHKHHSRKFRAHITHQSSRINHHKYGSNRSVNQPHRLTDAQIRSQVYNQTLKDINTDREENGRSPVASSPIMNQIANMRARQASTNFTHYDASNNNTPYELEDANQLGIQFGKGAYTDNNGVTHYYIFTENIADNNGNNGRQVADNANNNMMYHDAKSNWGHRKNILYAPWKYVGIGVAPSTGAYSGDYTIAEDFADWARQGDNVEGNPNGSTSTHNTNNTGDTDSQSQSSYNYNSNNNNNNNSSSSSDNSSYHNPLAGRTIHKNGITVTYTKDGMIAHDNHGDTDSASGPNSTINIDGQTFTD